VAKGSGIEFAEAFRTFDLRDEARE
jgi:hypothetical protein